MSRKVGAYRTYENGEKQLIARVTSAFEAIDIAAEHIGKIEHTFISFGSEPEPGETEVKPI